MTDEGCVFESRGDRRQKTEDGRAETEDRRDAG